MFQVGYVVIESFRAHIPVLDSTGKGPKKDGVSGGGVGDMTVFPIIVTKILHRQPNDRNHGGQPR